MSNFFFYADESFDAERFCLSAIALRHDDWRDCLNAVQEHRKLLNTDYGIYIRKEIHARDLVAGRGHISPQMIGKHERSRIFLGLLNLIAKMPVHLFNVCLPMKGIRDPQLLAWDRLLNRIERTMLEFENRDIPKRKQLLERLPATFSEVEKKELSERLLRYHPRAIIFADEGKQVEITRAVRRMHKFNPIPSSRGGWPEGKTRNIVVERVLEDPVFRSSRESLFIQLADCAAFALLKREAPPTPNIEKYGIHNFFEQCLAGVCYKPACHSDPLGIVRK